MELVKSILKQYIWTSLVAIITIVIYNFGWLIDKFSLLFEISVFIFFGVIILLKSNIVFTIIVFFLGKIARLEILIAFLVLSLGYFVHLYFNQNYFTDYAEKVLFDGVFPENKTDFYIGNNMKTILFFVFLLVINLAYSLFFRKIKRKEETNN